jgi:hypothetical protein
MSAAARTDRRAVPTERWEQGSDLELSLETGTAELPWARHPHGLWGSARSALRALLTWGIATQGWRRLLLPSYFCQSVPAAVAGDIELVVYASAPTDTIPRHVAASDGDVVLLAWTFGLRPRVEVSGASALVEDFTHDPVGPAAAERRAQFAIASLRKTLPLPDGGVLWSPSDCPVPSEVGMTAAHAQTVRRRLSGMTLKRDYLAGGDVDKAAYRGLLTSSEREIGTGPISGISPFSRQRLPTLPVARWRDARAANLQVLRETLGELPGATFLEGPFAGVLLFDDAARRDRVQQRLIASRIYPCVLWPLDDPHVAGIPAEHVALANRMLAIHCDQRYGPHDMASVANQLRSAAGS